MSRRKRNRTEQVASSSTQWGEEGGEGSYSMEVVGTESRLRRGRKQSQGMPVREDLGRENWPEEDTAVGEACVRQGSCEDVCRQRRRSWGREQMKVGGWEGWDQEHW